MSRGYTPRHAQTAGDLSFANLLTTVHEEMVPIKHIEYWHLGDFTYLRETKPIHMMNYLFLKKSYTLLV